MRQELITPLVLACAVAVGGRVVADEKAETADAPAAPRDAAAAEAEMMKKWQELATPGKPHEALKPLEGKWNTVAKMWMAGPDAPATESKGSAEYKWILGGRHLQQTFKGELFGSPYNGISLAGYDNYKKQYTNVWVDSASTAVLTCGGLLDKTGKVITYYGKMDEWLTGERDKAVKYVVRIINEDQHVFEIHDLGIVDGDKENTKVLEITYNRAK